MRFLTFLHDYLCVWGGGVHLFGTADADAFQGCLKRFDRSKCSAANCFLFGEIVGLLF